MKRLAALGIGPAAATILPTSLLVQVAVFLVEELKKARSPREAGTAGGEKGERRKGRPFACREGQA